MMLPRLLSLLLAAVFAAEINGPAVTGRLPSVPALFTAPAVEWGQPLPTQTVPPLEAALSRMAATGLEVPSAANLPQAERLRALAPMIQQLAALQIDPAKFAAETPADQQAALELALHAAKEEVSQKAYELVGTAKALVWSQANYNRAQRDELYTIAAQLGEMKRYYLDFIPPEERDFVAQTELQARARFHDVQKALVEGTALPSAAALTHGTPASGRDALSPVSAAPQRRRVVLGTSNARKLLQDMRNSRFGWRDGDFISLFKGFDFNIEQGGSHIKFSHPRLPANRYMSLTRSSGDVSPRYAADAVELIDELDQIVNGPELPASAITESREVPPLPLPGAPAESPAPKAAPSATAAASPKPARPAKSKKSPAAKTAPAVAAAAPPAATATLAPATPHEVEKKPETPAPALAPQKSESDEGLLARLRRLLGR